MPYLDALRYIFPELFLTLALMVVLVHDIATKGRAGRVSAGLSLVGLAITAGLVLQRWHWAAADVFGLVHVDRFALLFKLFMIATVATTILIDVWAKHESKRGRGEFNFLLLTAALGGFFLVGTYHLLQLYLALETLGLASYILAGMNKKDGRSGEAALKYVVYGALASGVLLYGASLLYGIGGSLDLRILAPALLEHVQAGRELQVAIPTLMLLVGFGFKLSFLPFHWWAPDVYEGSPTPITAFLAVGSKGLALAAFLRVLAGGFAGFIPLHDLSNFDGFRGTLAAALALIAAATMVFGNFAALRQSNLKRLLAYSSIGHAGYMLMGVALLGPVGFEAATTYLLAYFLMNLGVFAMLVHFANVSGREDVDGLAGLGWRHPWVGAATIALLASLAGLPPTAGFTAKFYLFYACWDGGLAWLTVVAALTTVVSLFYYFRIAKALFLKGGEESGLTRTVQPGLASMVAVFAVASVFLLYIEPLRALAGSVQTLF